MVTFSLSGYFPAKAREPVAGQITMTSVTTATLVEICQVEPKGELVMDPCNSYIFGAVDGLSMGRLICMNSPSALTLIASGTVRKYLKDHPEEWGHPPIGVIYNALRTNWACPRTR
jgi:hypothetical protein